MNDFTSLIKDRYGENNENLKNDTSHSESNKQAYRELKQPQIPDSNKQDYFDKYEGYDEENSHGNRGRVGGGGAGGKKHPEHHGKTTRRAIAENQVRASEINRGKEARTKILRILAGFPELGSRENEDRFIDSYLNWLQSCFSQNKLILEPQFVKLEFSRSSGAGGQNVNKVETAVRARHLKTNVTAHNEEQRSQSENREAALKHLQSKLLEHLKDWRTWLHSENKKITDITRYDILDMMAEALSN